MIQILPLECICLMAMKTKKRKLSWWWVRRRGATKVIQVGYWASPNPSKPGISTIFYLVEAEIEQKYTPVIWMVIVMILVARIWHLSYTRKNDVGVLSLWERERESRIRSYGRSKGMGCGWANSIPIWEQKWNRIPIPGDKKKTGCDSPIERERRWGREEQRETWVSGLTFNQKRGMNERKRFPKF